MLVYSNNGLFFRRELAGYVAQAGEVIFPDDPVPTAQQLTAAFPDYPTAIAAAAAAAAPKPTPRAWLERLAPSTQAAITAAAARDTTGAMLLWLLKAAGNPTIDVTSQETISGVAAMVTAGVITAQDQATLLAP